MTALAGGRPVLRGAILVILLLAAAGAGRAEDGRPLLVESFDTPEALDVWKPVEGATTGPGPGPASAAALDDGALKLSGDAATRRWLAFTREVPLGGARWIRVSARMRTEGVDPASARFRNCDVFVRFAGGPVQALPVFAGTTPWTAVARRFPVPKGARAVVVACFLSMPGAAWFDDVRVEAAPEWREERAGHYVYRTLPGDAVPEAARAFNEASYAAVRAFFGGEGGPESIVYWKYPSNAVKAEYTGNAGNAHVDGGAIHGIWAADRHEVVHLFEPLWGDAPALLAEGLAVHLSGSWQGAPVREAARRVLEAKKWIALGEILDTRAFRGAGDEATYPIGGALAGWLLEAEGKEKLRALYAALKNGAPLGENRAAFERALGMSIEEADAALRGWVRR